MAVECRRTAQYHVGYLGTAASPEARTTKIIRDDDPRGRKVALSDTDRLRALHQLKKGLEGTRDD